MRTYTVHIKEEFEKERNNLIVASYKTKQEVGGESARLIKKKKFLRDSAFYGLF